jgi:hypothetical protein
MRALIAAGCQTVVLTNAAGGVGEGLQAGDLVLIRDHLNLMGDSPLRGPNDARLGVRFPDMTEVYDAKLRATAQQVAARLQIRMPTGVYAGLLGPQYETPSEVKMLRGLGADWSGCPRFQKRLSPVTWARGCWDQLCQQPGRWHVRTAAVARRSDRDGGAGPWYVYQAARRHLARAGDSCTRQLGRIFA